MSRVYMDWNASAPLHPEARAAMIEAMDVVGNPSSVHTEGRAAKAVVERARGQIIDAIGTHAADIVFTSGATEALNLTLSQDWHANACSPFEHEAVTHTAEIILENFYSCENFSDKKGYFLIENMISGFGVSYIELKKGDRGFPRKYKALFTLCAANSETGVLQPYRQTFQEFNGEADISHRMCDATQALGKISFIFDQAVCEYAVCSSHKIGGPRGVGALIVKSGIDLDAQIKGGGQEMGRRSGTENVIGIAGFGAAAEAAKRDLENGEWDRVAELRDYLEDRIAEIAPDTIFFGKGVPRLPNTSCFAVPGWKGETQVMQMDLAGYAISAGSACSSGKVKPSRVLQAMGYDEITAGSAIRVSLGPPHTKDDIDGFAAVWGKAYHKFRAKAA